LDLLIVDAFSCIADHVGYSYETDFKIISNDIEKTMTITAIGIHPSSSYRFKSNLCWNMSQSVTNSSGFSEFHSATNSYAEKLLSPLKAKGDYHSFSFSENFFDTDTSYESSGLFPSKQELIEKCKGSVIVFS
jgi:hypothetical protein